MTTREIAAAVAVIDDSNAAIVAVTAAAAQLKAVLLQPSLTADAVASSRNISRVLGRVATSDGLQAAEWDLCTAAVVQGLLHRGPTEVPWIQRAFAAKTLATAVLVPSWVDAVVTQRTAVVFTALLQMVVAAAADEAQQRFYREQLLAVAQRFGEGSATAAVATAAAGGPGLQALAMLLASTTDQSHATFLAALDRGLPNGHALAARIPAYTGKATISKVKATLDGYRSMETVANAAAPTDATSAAAWAAEVDACRKVLWRMCREGAAPPSAASVTHMTKIAVTAAAALQISTVQPAEGSDTAPAVGAAAEQQLLVMRAATPLLIMWNASVSSVASDKAHFAALSALSRAALAAASFTAQADIADAQIPLAETGLLLAKAVAMSTFFTVAGDETEGGKSVVLSAHLKAVSEHALPDLLAAQKAVNQYFNAAAEADGRVGAKRDRAQPDTLRISVSASNLCVVSVTQLVQFFAGDIKRNVKITPSWLLGGSN